MKQTEFIMGMPITIEIPNFEERRPFKEAFSYFREVDERFSTYKDTSEIMQINRGELPKSEYSPAMNEVLRLCEETKQKTKGYFDIKKPDGSLDPSGLVKGWSIYNAAKLIAGLGIKEFYVDASGDIEVRGKLWDIGIKNPFNQEEIIKVVYIKDKGIATSGTYIRGDHIYDPMTGKNNIDEIVSLTVIGPNVYEADRFATAAFAMGKAGIDFIETLPGFEGYLVDKAGVATMTTGFEPYTVSP